MIKKILSPLALGAALALVGGNQAFAESQYGYATSTGTITATAKVNLTVNVPKLILLRVGGASTAIDSLIWNAGFTIPSTSAVPALGSDKAVDWNGAIPTASVTAPASSTLNVYAWTNANTGSINCTAPIWSPASGGPANADFTVTVTGSLPHPGANLGACASTPFSSNTVATGTWQYILGGTPTSWKAGTYSTTVTYTATGV